MAIDRWQDVATDIQLWMGVASLGDVDITLGSRGESVTEINRFAPPRSDVSDVQQIERGTDIEALQVSPAWKQRFYLIEKAGGAKQPKFKELSGGERMKIGFNILAFLFGPIYYATKGMWRKALSLFGACLLAILVLSVVLELVGLGRFGNALGYGAAALFAIRANIDYYKKLVLGDNGWW